MRLDWAASYHGEALVVYGHTPALHPEWVNRTLCIDTGCVFGGALTALRYPEMELVSVPALKTYAEPKRPLVPEPNPPAPFPGKEGGEREAPSGRVTAASCRVGTAHRATQVVGRAHPTGDGRASPVSRSPPFLGEGLSFNSAPAT